MITQTLVKPARVFTSFEGHLYSSSKKQQPQREQQQQHDSHHQQEQQQQPITSSVSFFCCVFCCCGSSPDEPSGATQWEGWSGLWHHDRMYEENVEIEALREQAQEDKAKLASYEQKLFLQISSGIHSNRKNNINNSNIPNSINNRNSNNSNIILSNSNNISSANSRRPRCATVSGTSTDVTAI